ncbi:MAG: hypothetical protein QXF74_05140 [Nitrososphaerota archaeon]
MRRKHSFSFRLLIIILIIAGMLFSIQYLKQQSMMNLNIEIVDEAGKTISKVPIRQNPLSIIFFWERGQVDITSYVGLNRYIKVTPVVTINVAGDTTNIIPFAMLKFTWTTITLNNSEVQVKNAQLMSADYQIGTEVIVWVPMNQEYELNAQDIVIFIPIDQLVSKIPPGQVGELRLQCRAYVEIKSQDYSTLASKTEIGTFTCFLKNTG